MFKRALILTSLILALAITGMAVAATSNPPPGAPGYTPMVIPIMGTYSSTTTVVKFKAPSGYRIVTANAAPRAVTGTNPTLKLAIRNGSFTAYSSSLAAGTITDLKPSTNVKITDEGTVTVDFTKGGSYSSGQGWKDITLFLLLKRL